MLRHGTLTWPLTSLACRDFTNALTGEAETGVRLGTKETDELGQVSDTGYCLELLG